MLGKMKDLDKMLNEIIDEKLTDDEISKLYMSDEIMKNEMFLLSACENIYFLKKFLTGTGEFKLRYVYGDDDLYFTNVDMVLSAFYSLYERYPQYHFDKILEYALNKFSKDTLFLYEIINVIYAQMKNEEENVSPFKVVTVDMLKNCKESLEKVKEAYKSIKMYEASNRENGYMDVISDLNQGFKKIMNYDILEDGNDDSERNCKTKNKKK